MNTAHPLIRDLQRGSPDDEILLDHAGVHSRLAIQHRVGELARHSTVLEQSRVAVSVPTDFGSLCALFVVHQHRGIAWLGAEPPVAAFTPIADSPLTLAVATSGSTGAPKRVAIEEDNLSFVTDSIVAQLGLGPHDRVYCPLSLGHTYGLSTMWSALRAGARLHLPRLPALAGDLLRHAQEATVLALVPGQLRLLLAALRANPTPLPQLRLVTLAGQSTPASLRAAAAEALPHVAFVVCYGMTEASTRISMQDPRLFRAADDQVGSTLAGVEVRIEAGELLVRGPNVAAGYFDDPVATETRFGGRWLRTGDAVDIVEGQLRWLGRFDGMIKRFGEKIFPEQVEQALGNHPDVDAVRIRSRLDPDGEPALVAEVVLRTPRRMLELRRDFRALVPAYAVPDRLEFVTALPLTENGKISRK